MAPLPRYNDLPVSAGRPASSSWGLWGEGDVLGSLNLLTPDRIVNAARLVRMGKVFSLALDMHLPDPPLFRRERTEHTVLPSPNGFAFNDRVSFNTQASTQWDGFRHMRHPEHGFYGGLAAERHGIHHWARRGIVGRAVLCDLARWRERTGRRPIEPGRSDPIEPEEVRACLAAEAVEVTAGDILLLRTGWAAWYKRLGPEERTRYVEEGHPACGLRPGRDVLALLWDLHIAAVAADNPGVEVMPPGALLDPAERAAWRADPSRAPEVFLHLALIPLLGVVIGELFDFDDLAEHCAREGRFDALFASAPVPLIGGVASPANALAIV